MTVQVPSEQGCHKVTFETCDEKDPYQQWMRLQSQRGTTWMNSWTNAAIGPSKWQLGQAILACSDSNHSNHHVFMTIKA